MAELKEKFEEIWAKNTQVTKTKKKQWQLVSRDHHTSVKITAEKNKTLKRKYLLSSTI